MADTLIYQTSDPAFADRVIEALNARGIACYRVGEGTRNLRAPGRRLFGERVSLFIRDEREYEIANKILLELGGLVEKQIRMPNRWVVLVLVAIWAAVTVALVL